jgi:hypothetical protein
MTCLFTEGFESVMDDTDLIARGWLRPTTTVYSGAGTLTLPARTGQAGRGLYLRGPYSATLSLPCAATTTSDFGLYNTQQTIYSLWQSGGFAVGMSGTFNRAGTVNQIAPYDSLQIVYDGAQYYWAICYSGTTLTVAYSPDLVNWTLTSATPASINANSTIQVVGSGTSATIIVSTKGENNTFTTLYSTNMGGTWTAVAIPSGSSSVRGFFYTGSATAPYIMIGYVSNVGYRVYYYTSISGTGTEVASFALAGTTTYYGAAFCKNLNGTIITAASYTNTSTAYSYPVQNANAVTYFGQCSATADPTNAANWSSLPSIAYQINDLTWFNNRWIAVGVGGIWWNGAASNNTWTYGTGLTLATNFTVWSVACSGSLAIAVGQDPTNLTMGAIWTSPDGVNWTKVNRFILSSVAETGYQGNNFSNVIWDGTRFIITGGLNNNVIATSPDGFAWTPVYYPDYAESVQGNTSCAGLGIFSGTQAATGIFTGWSTSSSYYVGITSSVMEVTAASPASYRTVYGVILSGSSAGTNVLSINIPLPTIASGNAPASQYTHYYEYIATATSTQNQFTVQWAVDGVIQGTLGTLQLATTTDTGTAQLFVNLPRNGNIVMVDDIYLTNMNGSGDSGQQGVVSVFPCTLTGDVQDQFTPTNTSLTHAAQVSGALSMAENSISSYTTGQKDIYSMSATIPAHFTVKAVRVEAMYSKSGMIPGKGTVGIINGGTEMDSSAVAPSVLGGTAFASLVLDKDPNTGAVWTNAGFATAELAVTKTG